MAKLETFGFSEKFLNILQPNYYGTDLRRYSLVNILMSEQKRNKPCVKIFRILSFSGHYFSAFGPEKPKYKHSSDSGSVVKSSKYIFLIYFVFYILYFIFYFIFLK